MTRLGACSKFTDKTITERAAIVQWAGGCALCLDWMSNHQMNYYTSLEKGGVPFSNCKIDVNGMPCRGKYNVLLHGPIEKHSNYVSYNDGVKDAPNNEDGMVYKAQTTPLPMQWVIIYGNVDQALTFWDSGSNVNIIQ